MNLQWENRRSDPRSTIPLTPVRIGNDHEYYFGVAMNISRSGMYIQTSALINQGSVLNIRFTLPKTNKTVTCRGKVMWNRSLALQSKGFGRGGLRFMDMDPELADGIDQWVRDQIDSRGDVPGKVS